MIDIIFLAVQAYLQCEVPELLEIEWFLHQYDENGNAFQIQSPALYIEFVSQAFEDIGLQCQQALATVNLHVLQEDLLGEGRITDRAMNHYGLVKQVYTAMQGHAFLLSDVPDKDELKGTDNDTTLTGPWSRTAQVDDHGYTNMLHTILQFKVAYRDTSAEPQYKWVTAGLETDKWRS